MNCTSSCLALSPHAEITPQVFGIPLSQVMSTDRTHKQRHSPQREGHSDPTELMLSFLHLTSSYKRANKELSSSNSSLSSTSETPHESPPLRLPDVAPRTHRRVGVGRTTRNESILYILTGSLPMMLPEHLNICSPPVCLTGRCVR